MAASIRIGTTLHNNMATYTYWRLDVTVTDTQGNAIPNAYVYWVSQPATVTTVPPSPLVTVYTDSSGSTEASNPQITNGFGQVFAYMPSGVYTIVTVWNGKIQSIYPDQSISNSNPLGVINNEIPSGSINGINTVYELAYYPVSGSVSLYMNGVLLLYGVDFTVNNNVISMAFAPISGYSLVASYVPG
jgi:hypothetical protein